MRRWTPLVADRFVLHWPVALRVFDALSGGAPQGRVGATLYRDSGTLVPTDVPCVLTPSWVLTYPALGRRRDASTVPARNYQVRLDADLYVPAYRATASGIDFVAQPYDDATPPAGGPPVLTDAPLMPSPAYPFPGHLSVLRGVVTVGGDLTSDVLVSWTGTLGGNPVVDRTLTDRNGAYALALRWAPTGVPIRIVADYTPPGGGAAQSASIDITLPDDLGTSQPIAIP